MTTTALVPAPLHTSLTVAMAQKYGLDPEKFLGVVRATVFPADRQATNEQLAAFLTVAKQYDLNPFIKEIYAFPAKGGGIVPIVSIDGWCSLINRQPMMDGLEFEDQVVEGKLVAVTCKIYRKDRSHPMSVTEYMHECTRSNDVWGKYPSRMLRHKALIQCARYAFALSGIYDPDEAERIQETNEGPTVVTYETPSERTQLIAGDLKKFVAQRVTPATQAAESGTHDGPDSPPAPSEATKPVSVDSGAKNEPSTRSTNGIQGFQSAPVVASSAVQDGAVSTELGQLDSSGVGTPARVTAEASPVISQVVKVTDAELRNKRGGKGQFWLLTCTLPEMPDVGELSIHVWDKKLWEYASSAKDKVCEFGLSRSEKEEVVYYALEEIYRIGDVLFENNAPAGVKLEFK